jgi:hypothetical protein
VFVFFLITDEHDSLRCMVHSFRDNKPLIKVPVVADKILRSSVEMCAAAVSLALAAVCAGTGDVDVLRILRELRWKVDDVTYGTHMALSMAIGELVNRLGVLSCTFSQIFTLPCRAAVSGWRQLFVAP